MKKTVYLCLLCAAVWTCNKDDDTEETSATIGNLGGTLVSKDGKLTLEVPEGSVANDTTFTITEANGTSPGNVGPAYELGPSDQTFKFPVKLTFAYAAGEIGAGDPAELWVAVEHEGRWLPVMASSVDEKKKTVTAEVTHFSKYSKILTKLRQILAIFGGNGNPCLCDMDDWKTCCLESGPLNPKVPGVWAPMLSPKRCSCANADSYALNDCYEKKAGYEFGGCTACERKCCKAAGAALSAWNGECSCFPSGASEKCLEACKDNMEHLTKCEISQAQWDVQLSILSDDERKDFCKLIDQILYKKDISGCSLSLSKVMKECATFDLVKCPVSTQEVVGCAMAVAKNGCPGPEPCEKLCLGLIPGPDLGPSDGPRKDVGATDGGGGDSSSTCKIECKADNPPDYCTGCDTTCQGHNYMVACTSFGSCTCYIDSVSTPPTHNVSCKSSTAMTTAWIACGFPGLP